MKNIYLCDILPDTLRTFINKGKEPIGFDRRKYAA